MGEVVWWYGGGGGIGCAYLAHLLLLILFPPTPLPSLPTHSPPYSPLTSCVTIIRGRLRGCSGQELSCRIWQSFKLRLRFRISS